MGTFYNSRALEWFEVGRTELTRTLGIAYAEMEARGVLLPVIEAHVEYLSRAAYDDLLRIVTTATMVGRARIRFDVRISHAESQVEVVRGYTVHAFTDRSGKPMPPPAWVLKALAGEGTG